LALIFAGGIFLFKNGLDFGGSSSSSVILREAQRGLTPVVIEGGQDDILESAVDLTTQKAILSDVMHGGAAKASATRSFGGGSYILSVEATLPDPINVNYAVWVVGGGETILIDYMTGSKTSWSLSKRARDEYSNYDGIWITLERTKDDFVEEHVMEGTF